MSSSAPLGTRSSTAIAAGQPVRSSSFMRGAWRVFELSLGEMLWSRRTVFLAIVVGCPVLVAAVIRIVDSLGVVPLRINGQRMDFTAIFGVMIWLLFLRFIVPVLGVFYGTALIADEVEDKTITYLFTRPIRRSAVLIGKYIAYLVCTTLVVLPGVVLVDFLIVPFQQVGASFGMLVTDLALLAIARPPCDALRRRRDLAPAGLFHRDAFNCDLPLLLGRGHRGFARAGGKGCGKARICIGTIGCSERLSV